MKAKMMDVAAFEQAFGVVASKPAVVDQLREAGFLQVRGLKTRSYGSSEQYPIEPNADDPTNWLGKWDSNNGLVSFWTEGGECWVATRSVEAEALVQALAIKGAGANVPLSNGERLDTYDMLCRSANPYWVSCETLKELEENAQAEALADARAPDRN